MTPFFLPADHAAVASASRILYSRYRDFVAYEDVSQELYLWLYEHYDRAERWRGEFSEKHAERTLTKALRNAGDRYCRNEKANWRGYDVEDEEFYSIPMIADLLRLSFDPDWGMMSSLPLDTEGGEQSTNPSETLRCMVADVGKAYGGLPDHDRALLKRAYDYDVETADVVAALACEWGITAKAADSRLRRVLGRLRAALGGPSPYGGK